MDFSRRVAVIVAAVLAVAFGVMLALAIHDGRAMVRQQTHQALSGVSLMSRVLFTRAGGVALAEAELLARQPETRAALAARDRAALATRFGEGFPFLKAAGGIEMLGFQTADLKLLLSLDDPAQTGEAAVTQPMVIATNRARRGQRGIEMGPGGLAAVYGTAPVLQGETLVGTVAAGIPLTSMLYAIKNTTGAETAAVLSASTIGSALAGRPSFGDLVISESTDGKVFDRLLQSAKLNLVKDDQESEAELGDDTYGVLVTPLVDFSGRSIGVIIGAKPMTPLFAALQHRMLLLLAVAGCGMLVSYSVVRISLRALVVRPLLALATHAERVAGGEDVPDEAPRGAIAAVERLAAATAQILAQARPQPAASLPTRDQAA